jgi:hypothetical protein
MSRRPRRSILLKKIFVILMLELDIVRRMLRLDLLFDTLAEFADAVMEDIDLLGPFEFLVQATLLHAIT